MQLSLYMPQHIILIQEILVFLQVDLRITVKSHCHGVDLDLGQVVQCWSEPRITSATCGDSPDTTGQYRKRGGRRPLERDLSRIVVFDLRIGGTKLLVCVLLSLMVMICNKGLYVSSAKDPISVRSGGDTHFFKLLT